MTNSDLPIDRPAAWAPRTGLRILVVDDDPQVLSAMIDMLSLDGHTAVAVSDAYAALTHLSSNGIDLLITDLGLPGMSGLELAKQANESGYIKRAVLVTGLRPDLTPEMLTEAGVSRLLYKPFRISDLNSIVEVPG